MKCRIFYVFSIFLILFTFSCKKDEFKIDYTKNVLTYDWNGKTLAQFAFTQYANDEIHLSITNLSGQTLSFTYFINFWLNMASWESQGYVTNLSSNQSIDKGLIAKNPARIDLGTITINLY
jgi:hypothetical protein